MNNSSRSVPEASDFGLEAILTIKEQVSLGEAVSVQFTLVNGSDEDLFVLDWYTPLEGLFGDIFRVERNGNPVPYQGILAKRGIPQPDEYVNIKPGGSVSAEVELSTGYDFSIPGNYTIEYLSPSVSRVVSKEAMMAKALENFRPIRIGSNSVTMRIVDAGEEGYHPILPPPSPFEGVATEEAKKITYDNCSASAKNIVKKADFGAGKKSKSIYSYLKGLSEDKAKTELLYKTWFGAYTAIRYSKVLNNWKKIEDAFLTKNITYNCKGPNCKPNWYAYVTPGGKLEVFLCKQFWNAPDTGTDTKYGTLIHEVSHEVAGTKDHEYGQTDCKNLAQNSPDKAIENADNYEYFAEHYVVPLSPALIAAAVN